MQTQNLTYGLLFLPLMLFALWQSGSCKSAQTETMPKEQNRVTIGTWGGQNIRLNLTDSGAELQFSCAHGTINQPLTVDDEGRFNAKGTFVAETPGPLREDRPPKTQPALYEGSVKNQDMTLKVTITETKEKVGEFTLKHGSVGRVHRCL